ncbi:hypothetical protein B0O99DRAFT_624053 [Bisporella sp. PMI_857]|nr:hypothetical protein B0O99DRAFT_624053 [Bisporella sp. PMI_857]
MYSEHTAAVAAPPQRRRRPALACLQCRRRKIKCDQSKPCNQCQRSRDVVCTYDSDLNPHNSRQGHINIVRHELEAKFQLHTPESSIAATSAAHSPQTITASNSAKPNHSGHHAAPEYSSVEGFRTFVDTSSIEPTPASWYSPDVERHVTDRESMPDLSVKLRKYPLKTKLYGENHWINNFTQFDKIATFMFDTQRNGASDNPTELFLNLQQCKILARTIKSHHPDNGREVSGYKSTLPAKEVCDELVGNYFRNYESVYRILHIPSFYSIYNDYWNDPDENNCDPRILLILAIGTVFLPDPETASSLHANARNWVYAVQQWLAGPIEKSRMNIRGVQTQCLLIIARETIGIGSDLIWSSIGTLIRTAMQLGYHRDPQTFKGISPLHTEIRRRLWATIMEMSVQASFSIAMPPLISLDDFDTEPPLNINDDEIGKSTITSPVPHPPTAYTQTSLQYHLYRSLSTRMEVVRITSSFRSDPSYDHVLRLSREITASCRFPFPSSAPQLTPFHLNHVDLLLRRFLFALHRPWVIKVKTDPRYYFSRKVVLDTALAHTSFRPNDDWERLILASPDLANGLPIMYISLELIWQLEEESPGAISTQGKLLRAPLVETLRRSADSQTQQIKFYRVNTRGAFFIAALLAQIEAIEDGKSEQEVLRAIKAASERSIKECLAILKARASDPGMQDANQKSSCETDTPTIAAAAAEGIGAEYDFLQDMAMGMDFELDTMHMGEFGNWGEDIWL